MKIYFSRYERTPLQKINRLSATTKKNGVLLRSEFGCYADYFPHTELGDLGVDEFLETFLLLKRPRDLKILSRLKQQTNLPESVAFKNHELLITKSRKTTLPYIKYKIKDLHDFDFCQLNFEKVRLDANGLFINPEEVNHYLRLIPKNIQEKIEYIEDPTPSIDWGLINVATAKDFIEGSGHEYLIYKPDLDFYKNSAKPVIFSSYLGHELGTWQAYEELVQKGNLDLVHGLVSEGVYKEEKMLFDCIDDSYFKPNVIRVHDLFASLHGLDWKYLCTL